MTQQEEVEGLVKEVQEIKTNLTTATTNITTEFAEIEKQITEGKSGSEVNLGPLKEAIAELKTPSEELENLKPVPVSDQEVGKTDTAADDAARASV